MALLLRPVLIVTEDLIDASREGLQLRTPDRLLPAIPRRQAVAQHLAHRLSGQPEAARRRARAPPLHLHAALHHRIELHSIHPSCVPQNTLGMLGGPLGSMRRYVPVVLPLTMLFGALTVVTLLARVAAATYRRGLTLAPGALLVGLVARPSVAVVGQPLWDDALAQTAQVARLFPDQAVVLVSPDLAGTHIPTSLAYLHDADAILVQERNPDDQVMRRVIRAWLARGRAVFIVVGQPQVELQLPLPLLSCLKAVREGFFELCVRVGEQALHALMEHDRTELCGTKWSRDASRRAVRGGSTASEITLGGRRIRVRRLRAAQVDGQELALPSFAWAAARDPLDEQTWRSIVAGVSTRSYASSLDPGPAALQERSTSRSAVSRSTTTTTRSWSPSASMPGAPSMCWGSARGPRRTAPWPGRCSATWSTAGSPRTSRCCSSSTAGRRPGRRSAACSGPPRWCNAVRYTSCGTCSSTCPRSFVLSVRHAMRQAYAASATSGLGTAAARATGALVGRRPPRRRRLVARGARGDADAAAGSA